MRTANISINRCNSLLGPMTPEELFRDVVHTTAKHHEVVEGMVVDMKTQTRRGGTYNGPLLGGCVAMTDFVGGLEADEDAD